MVGETAAPPHGKLFQLILLSICAYLGGWLTNLTTLPALIGMLFTGVFMQNVGIVNLDDSFAEVANKIRQVFKIIFCQLSGKQNFDQMEFLTFLNRYLKIINIDRYYFKRDLSAEMIYLRSLSSSSVMELSVSLIFDRCALFDSCQIAALSRTILYNCQIFNHNL